MMTAVLDKVYCQFVVILVALCGIILLLHDIETFQIAKIREPHQFSYQIVKVQKTRVLYPNCSFTVFRKNAKRSPDGYVHGYGTWQRNNAALRRFYPAICNLQYGIDIPGEKMAACLRKQNIRYIVIMGDSNGKRYFNALYGHLNRTSAFKCTPIDFVPIVNWQTYERRSTYIVHRCRCGPIGFGRCVIGFTGHIPTGGPLFMKFAPVQQARCRVNARLYVVIEYVRKVFTLEKHGFIKHKTGCQPSKYEPVIPTTSDTNEQFLLAEYFADPRPDLFILFGNAHDRALLGNLTRDIEAVAELFDRYVKAPTRLIWISKLAEYIRRKPMKWRNRRYENGTMSRLEYIDAANKIMYQKMRQRFLNTDKLLLFPDLLPMSKPVLRDYSIDGVHMKPPWYRHVVSYILQSLCTLE